MSEVYICYSKWNQNEAAEITSLLESAGIGCRLLSRDLPSVYMLDDSSDLRLMRSCNETVRFNMKEGIVENDIW